MAESDVDLSLERSKTDASLQLERKTTDGAVLSALDRSQRSGESELERRRVASDEDRLESRRDTDESRAGPSAPTDAEALRALNLERRHADEALRLERAQADRALEAAKTREREANRSFAEEREKTDRDLGAEREQTDVLVDEQSRSQVAQDELMATAGHDLKNALHSIELNAALLTANVVEPGAVTRRGHAIRSAVAQATGIIEDLARREPVAEAADAVDSRTAVMDAIHVLLPLAEEKSVALVAEVPGEPGVVHADPSVIGRILSNLIGNAIKFTPAGGTVTVRAERTAGGVHFRVSDSGVGISSEHLSRIFERGFRGDPSGSEGLGLGLAIVKTLVEERGGEVGVESVTGKGSTFSFALP